MCWHPHVFGQRHAPLSVCDLTFVDLQTYSSKPNQKSLTVLRQLVSYVASHSDISVSLKWSGHNFGIYHGYPDVSQTINIFEVFTDSDRASDRQTRRSVSSCVMFYGGCMLYSASRTQKIVSFSSVEAEVYCMLHRVFRCNLAWKNPQRA